jgi:hypothetical protein
MWLWESELRELGFRRKAARYWLCERGFGLEGDQHMSLFSWAEQTRPGGAPGSRLSLVEVSAFHVTFTLQGENIHFYYHEYRENEWQPAGHTSSAEICRLGLEPAEWREMADEIAARFVEALGGVYYPRDC